MAVQQAKSRNGVNAIEQDLVVIGPLTLTVSMEEFQSWLRSAEKSDEEIYAQGPQLPKNNAVCKKAYDLAQSGHLQIFQKRGDRGLDYIARRTAKALSPKPVAEMPVNNESLKSFEAKLEGTDAGKLLAILKRSANMDRKTPSLRDLASMIGLGAGESGRQRVRYLKNKLEADGIIEILPRRNSVHVVRIVSTGKTTREGV